MGHHTRTVKPRQDSAIGNETALSVFDTFGSDAVYARNRELSDLLTSNLSDSGRDPVDLPTANRSTIVSVPLGETEPAALLTNLNEAGIKCSASDGNLRLAIHLYNHEDDINHLVSAIANP